MRHKPNVKRQVIADQVARGPASAVEIKNVKSGEGLQ
jgi:NADH-quinone oxidoreductase subunit J